jgi:hypothetical protein
VHPEVLAVLLLHGEGDDHAHLRVSALLGGIGRAFREALVLVLRVCGC